jgi:hypothetical protein
MQSPQPRESVQPSHPNDSAANVFLKRTFVAGFASIFLINSLSATLQQGDLINLLAANPLSRSIGHYGVATQLIMVNNLLLGMLILSGWKKKYVWAWAGVWLLLVAIVEAFYIF